MCKQKELFEISVLILIPGGCSLCSLPLCMKDQRGSCSMHILPYVHRPFPNYSFICKTFLFYLYRISGFKNQVCFFLNYELDHDWYQQDAAVYMCTGGVEASLNLSEFLPQSAPSDGHFSNNKQWLRAASWISWRNLLYNKELLRLIFAEKKNSVPQGHPPARSDWRLARRSSVPPVSGRAAHLHTGDNARGLQEDHGSSSSSLCSLASQPLSDDSKPLPMPAIACGASAAAFPSSAHARSPPLPSGSFRKLVSPTPRRLGHRLAAPMASSTVDSPGSSSDFAKRMDRAWLISKQPRPTSCSSCQSIGDVECRWCAGTGFFILGNNMLCEVPSKNTRCVICSGKGFSHCADCKGTGFRAKWLEEPPVEKWTAEVNHSINFTILQ